MVEPQKLRDLAWALTSTTELVLFVYLVRQRVCRSYPAFFFYLVAAFLQSAAVFAAYRQWGFLSRAAWGFAWGTQGLMNCFRWLATIEIGRRILSGYSGIWGLAKRVLLVISVVVLTYSLLFWRKDAFDLVIYAERGVHLAIASFIVTLLLFARYYRLPLHPLDRTVAIGFFLYSCFSVINYSVFQRWIENSSNFWTNFWNCLDILTFLATLLIWIYAFRSYPVEARAGNLLFISPESYEKLSGQVTVRLRMLNDRLAHALHAEDARR